MKKYLLLLLFTSIVFSQNPTRFPYGINLTNSPDYSAGKVIVKSDNNNLSYQLLSQFMLEKGYMSTGLLQSGELSVNADPTKFDISASVCVFTDYTDANEPVSIIKNFPAIIGTTPTNLLTNPVTYVALDIDGNVEQSSSPFSREQSRDLVMIGFVVHRNLTTIQTVFNLCEPSSDVKNQVFDFFNALGNFNIDGNVYAPNGANLNLDKTAGVLFYSGANFHTNFKDPNRLALGQLTALSFQYRTQLGVDQTATTSINPNIYDVAGTVTVVPSNKYTIQTVYITPQNQTKIVLGQNLYNSLTEAENAIATRSFVIDASTKAQLVPRAYIVIKEGVTSLQDATHCKIKEAGKFAGTSSSGASVTLESVLSALGYTPEDVANKSNSFTASSTTTYPNTKALVDGLALKRNIADNPTLQQVSDAGKTVTYPEDVSGMVIDITDSYGNYFNGLTINSTGTTNGLALNGNAVSIRMVNNYADDGINVISNGTAFHGSSANGTAFNGLADYGTAFDGYSYGGNAFSGYSQDGHAFNGSSEYGNAFNGYSNTSVPAIFGLPTSNTSNITEFRKDGVAQASISHDGKLTAKGGIITDTASAVGGASAGSALTVNQTWSTTGAATAIKVDVTDTASDSLSKLIDLRVGGSSKFTIYKTGFTSFVNGWTLGGMEAYNNYLTTPGTSSITSGNYDVFSVKSGSFAPTSGTATYTGYLFSNTINQTGGANGITRGLYLNPTFGAGGAFDFRAIEFSNNTGKGLWQTGTATNSLANLTLSTAPTTSAGTYDILTRNTSTGVVEKVASSTIATIASPTFTGTPSAPTATVGTNTTQIATTAFVLANSNANGILEYNTTGKTVWNNGRNNITTNTSFGEYALYSNTSGNYNVGLGYSAISANLNGSSNTAIGQSAMGNISSGSDNTCIGAQSGLFIGDGSYTQITSSSASTYIGSQASSLANGQTNEIVIGYNTRGTGSNTVVLGNSNINKTTIRGVIQQTTYTVASLPAGITGMFAVVTDATAPTYLGALTGGGSVVCPVFYNGTAWVSH